MQPKLGYLVGLALLVAPEAAFASATYPAELQSVLHMPCTPPCTICHRDNLGGMGTVVKPFGVSMKTVGHLGPANPNQIKSATDKLLQAGTDSDGDGTPDIKELEQGDDPNEKGVGSLCGGPTYGCGARVEPAGRLDGWAAVAALGTAAALLSRLRRRVRSLDGAKR